MRKLLNHIVSAIDLPPLNITYYLIGGQIVVFAITLMYPAYQDTFSLRGNLVATGEWWRIITFLFQPLVSDILFAAFTWYLFYIYGITLERWWGTTRFLLYILISIVGTVLLSFMFPQSIFSNGYIFNSLFLAFAYLFPDFELRLFFVIPVKIKWLAILSWTVTGISFIIAPIPNKIHIIVSVLNFILFFGEDIILAMKNKKYLRSKSIISKSKTTTQEIKHTCSVCHKNSIDDPYMGIRYCKICMPERCFCEDDFQKHIHPVN